MWRWNGQVQFLAKINKNKCIYIRLDISLITYQIFSNKNNKSIQTGEQIIGRLPVKELKIW